MKSLQIFQLVPIRTPPLRISDSALSRARIYLFALCFPAACFISFITQLSSHKLVNERNLLDYTAFWTAVGSMGIFFGAAIAIITVFEARAVARNDTLDKMLKEASEKELSDAIKLLCPAREHVGDSRARINQISENPTGGALREQYLDAIYLLHNYYIRLQIKYNKTMLPKKTLLDYESYSSVKFYYVVYDVLKGDEQIDGHDIAWRDWVRLCHKHYVAATNGDVDPTLATWRVDRL